MFSDLDDTIRQLLVRYVPLDLADIDVSFEAPDREWSGRLSRPSINCFMYDVRENLELREMDWRPQRNPNGSTTFKKPPRRIDATYLVTAWARAPEDEHRMLWRVLSALIRHPLMPDDVLEGALVDQPNMIQTKVAQPDETRTNPSDLWQALDNRIRPGVRYTVTLALDPDFSYTSPLTSTRILRLEDLPSGDVDGIGRLIVGGQVRDASNREVFIEGATVTLRETGARSTTDVDGKFQFAQAPRDRLTLVVSAPGRPEQTREFAVPSPNYDLEV